MDTSETYIKMCERAEEIQVISEQQKFDSHGNYYADSATRPPVFYLCCDCGTFEGRKENKRFIWLPRQDQLQEMVRGKKFNWIGQTPEGTVTFCGLEGRVLEADTFEQLWLAFVMEEKWGKCWINGEWEVVS